MPTRAYTLNPKYLELLAEAARLRLSGTPYEEIISTLGHWKSISACQKAVARYLKCSQTRIVTDSRNEAVALLESLVFELRVKFKRNKSLIVAREIRKTIREISLLQGDYLPSKTVKTDSRSNGEMRPITVSVVKSSKILSPNNPNSFNPQKN